MKIVFFIGSITGGGAERVVCDLADYLSVKGYDVEILVVTKTADSYLQNKNILVSSLEDNVKIKLRLLKKVAKFNEINNYIKNHSVDLYITFLPMTIISLLFFRKNIKNPVIISERNNPASYNKIVQYLMIKAVQKADGIVFQTENAAKFYCKSNRQIKDYVIIPNAIRNKYQIKTVTKRRKVIVAVGRLTAQKNYELLISAFYEFQKKYGGYELEIYGEGKLESKLKKKTKKLKIDNKVHFKGFVKNVSDKIYDAEMYILASNYEGIPNSLIEAMSIGVPVISTNCDGGGAELLINNGVNGILIEKNNVEQMVKAMTYYIAYPEIAKKYSEAAKYSIRKFNPDVIYDRWEEYIKNYQGKKYEN